MAGRESCARSGIVRLPKLRISFSTGSPFLAAPCACACAGGEPIAAPEPGTENAAGAPSRRASVSPLRELPAGRTLPPAQKDGLPLLSRLFDAAHQKDLSALIGKVLRDAQAQHIAEVAVAGYGYRTLWLRRLPACLAA